MKSFKKVNALVNFTEQEFSDGFYFAWENELGQQFADLIDVIQEEDWLYFESIITTIPSKSLSDIGYFLFLEPIFHKLDYLDAKRILCLCFIHCNDEDSYDLSNDVSVELGTYVDLELSFLEKVLQRFLELLDYTTSMKPNRDISNLERNISFLNEKIKNTRINH
ncbi:hypothetical protein [uncultured Kordia sp.]|uniref:hypothetical protein n=1 Tax=uncultured Kordia sp. TaxID=507699 RepID=UPI002636EF3A|nr:hypothetical protein [uncultured Kordia sp.]